jgi:hypothetical protein
MGFVLLKKLNDHFPRIDVIKLVSYPREHSRNRWRCEVHRLRIDERARFHDLFELDAIFLG